MKINNKRVIRHYRLRKRVLGTTEKPRLAVFRSNQYIYAQVIDDSNHKTLAFESDLKVNEGNKVDRSFSVGRKLAEKAVKLGIKRVVFDRGGFLYHGRIAKLAEGARSGGLEF